MSSRSEAIHIRILIIPKTHPDELKRALPLEFIGYAAIRQVNAQLALLGARRRRGHGGRAGRAGRLRAASSTGRAGRLHLLDLRGGGLDQCLEPSHLLAHVLEGELLEGFRREHVHALLLNPVGGLDVGPALVPTVLDGGPRLKAQQAFRDLLLSLYFMLKYWAAAKMLFPIREVIHCDSHGACMVPTSLSTIAGRIPKRQTPRKPKNLPKTPLKRQPGTPSKSPERPPDRDGSHRCTHAHTHE